MLYGCYMHETNYAQYDCVTGVYSREIINMFFVSQVSGLVESFDTGIFSDTINVINVKLCMMVLFIELSAVSHFCTYSREIIYVFLI